MRVLSDDRGAVTVEAALALCSLVAVMVMVIAAVSAASAHLRCLDAAREAARLVSRGEPQRAQEIAAAVAPRGATVAVRVTGDEVEVRVSAAVVPGIPALSLVGVAVGVMEPAAFLSSGATPGEGTWTEPPGSVPEPPGSVRDPPGSAADPTGALPPDQLDPPAAPEADPPVAPTPDVTADPVKPP